MVRLDDWDWPQTSDITHIAREEGEDDGQVGDDPRHHQDDVGSAKKGLHHRAVDSADIKSINIYNINYQNVFKRQTQKKSICVTENLLKGHSIWKSAEVDCIHTDSDRQTQKTRTVFLVRNSYLLFSPNFAFTGRASIFATYSA